MTKRTLEGQVAIVTGAARGIGRGIASRLAQEGASVVIWDRDVAAFDASEAGFVPAAVVAVDVSDFASVERGFAADDGTYWDDSTSWSTMRVSTVPWLRSGNIRSTRGIASLRST